MIKPSVGNNKIWDFLRWVERAGARGQGKGYATTMKREVMLVSSFLSEAPRLAVDIGGNVGDYSAELLKLNGEMDVHIFEPAAVNITKLKKRFSGHKNIAVVPCAVSASAGQQTLYSDEQGSGMGSLTKRKLDHFSLSFDCVEQIETIRFDDYWKNTLAKRAIDFVKIDVEGHEYDVLGSFGDALSASRVIQFEFGGTCIDTRVYFQNFWYLFKDAQFDLFRISPFGLQKINAYSESDESFVFTNYVAVNKRG